MGAIHPVQVARNRDFLLFQGDQLLSAAGAGASSVAFPLLALALTHSPARAESSASPRSLSDLAADVA